MFNRTKITNSLFGLVGIESPANPKYDVIDSANQESRSGRLVTNNPYVKVEYLLSNLDYKDSDDTQTNEFLSSLQKKAISDVVDRVLMEPDYIDRQVLYQYPNNKNEVEVLPASSFVGYRITKSNEKNVAFEIPRIFLEFEGTGDIELLLFNTAVKEPIKQKTITITSSQQVEPLGWRLDDTDNFFQGEYYIGYLTDGLTVQPIKRDYQKANIKSCITHLSFSNMYVTGVTSNELFDLSKEQGASESFGLNPDVTVFNDYTNLIMQHEAIFAPAIELQFVINCIETYIASDRSNREERLSTDRVNFLVAQIEGVPDRIIGYKPTLSKTITSLSKQIKRLKDGMFSYGFELNTLK